MKMSENAVLEAWLDAQEYQVPLNSQGKIIDFLEPDRLRENTPEERIRQKTGQFLHYELGYPREIMAFERTINIGRDRPRVDIVVYHDGEAKAINDQGRMYFIGETKSPLEESPDGQGKSYISATSAQGGFWTNGNSIIYYRKIASSGEIKDWPGLPRYGFAWDSIGRYRKEDLKIPHDLKLTFKRCHNAIYRTGISSEDVALDMIRIILAKIEDESTTREECDFHITPEEYENPELKKNACNRVRRLFSAYKERHTDVFSPSEEITALDDQLAVVISQLQGSNFLDAPYDVIGTAYEVYVASHLKGERGQYFTNRLVINMMVKMIDPSETDIILDPACGSGGFLIAAMNNIFNKIDKSRRAQTAKDILKRNVVHQLYGVDISPKLVKVAKANMLLGKDGHSGIEKGNSLDNISKLSASFREKAGIEDPTIILTNPPFGSGHDLRIKDPAILRQYDAGHNWDIKDVKLVLDDSLNTRAGVAPEILFLEKCIKWLKPGGKIGIVMAKGQLDNREALAIRHYVLSNCQVFAVVNLHEDTFQPFNGSKASVIFLKKPIGPVPTDYRIFMAISNKIGQTSRGEAIVKRDTEGNEVIVNNHQLLDEDLSDIADDFHHFLTGDLQESSFRFSMSSLAIDQRDLSFNPIHYLPAYNAAFQYVLSLGERDDFEVRRLGDIARVFNGPRFKRPYADLGVTEGPTIRKYFTGTALTQLNSENIKYLDSSRANRQTQKHLEALTIFKGYILISDSGTLGRVTYALRQHDGHVATNNLIRVVIENPYLRGYVYQFLKSTTGQSLMLKNAYGTNQEHLEPDVISEIPIPIPKDQNIIENIGKKVIESMELLENSIELGRLSEGILNQII